MPETVSTKQAPQGQSDGFRLRGLRSPIADMLRSIGQVGTGGRPVRGSSVGASGGDQPPAVLSVHFTRRIETPSYSPQRITHTVVGGDTLGSLAQAHDTTVAAIQEENGLTDTVIQVGQELSITTLQEVGREVRFETLSKASLGEQLYVLVTTRGMRGSTLYPTLKESDTAQLGEDDAPLPCQWQSADPDQPRMTVGALQQSDYLNRNTLADSAVIAVTLQPLDESLLPTWRTALATQTTSLKLELRGDSTLGHESQSHEVLRFDTPTLTLSGLRIIEMVRRWETDNSTISEFTVPDARSDEAASGYFLERPGPDTVASGQRLRIPEGDYELRWHTTSLASVKKFNPVPLLFNDQVAESRRILIHNGNYPKDTDGCLLIGSSRSTDFVGSSQAHYSKLLRYLRRVGLNTVLLRISSDY